MTAYWQRMKKSIGGLKKNEKTLQNDNNCVIGSFVLYCEKSYKKENVTMYTVIVADDEEELRKALIRKVDWEAAGFRVIGEAENGAEALELVEKLAPDLLLSDIKMPFMSGIELARAVREIRPTMQIAFLSGYDDFAYAQQAIQYNIISYMLKPISSIEITEELKKIKARIDETFEEFTKRTIEKEKQGIAEFLVPLLLDSFQGNISEERNARLLDDAKNLGFLGEISSNLFYTVLVTSFWDRNGKNCTTEAGVNSVDMILRKYVRHASFYTEGRLVSLLAATKSGLEKYLHIIVEDISQSVRRIMNHTVSIGVSRTVSKLVNCHEAYIEAMNAMGYSRKSDEEVYFIADIERTGTFDQEAVQGTVNELESLLRGGTKEELKQYLSALFVRVERGDFTPMMVQLLLVQMVAAVMRVAYAVADGESVQHLQSASPLQGKIIYDNSKPVWNQYIDFCLAAKEMVAEERKKSSTFICEQTSEIIENRYMDQGISLVSVSGEIAVSPNYLSALIKKMTGYTFVDLLTKKRIEVAKELLIGTSMKVREISERCGYNDQHYFSYCFKKYIGVSPNACRKEYEENRN